MNNINTKIYSLKENGKTIYIGKSNKLKDDLSNPSSIQVLYLNKKLRNIKNRSVEILENVEVDNWVDPKIKQIVEKHKQGAKLRNGEHLLNGNRGYWSGKKRDENTIKRLTESKFKLVCQYDLDGNLIKVWNSILEVAKHLDFKIDDEGKSRLNSKLGSNTFTTKKIKGYYWIKKEDIKFNKIPKKLNINNIIEFEKQDRYRRSIETRKKNGTFGVNNGDKEIVRIYPNGKRGKIFNSLLDAAKYYKISAGSISKVCRYITKSSYNGKYVFEFVHDKHKARYVDNKKRLEEKLLRKNNL